MSTDTDRMASMITDVIENTVTLDDIMGVLVLIDAKIDALSAAHSETVGNVDALVKKVEPHLAELGPMIDAIANNPMFKMLAGGSKKR